MLDTRARVQDDPLRVLVAADEDLVRKRLCRSLKGHVDLVAEAADGRQALELARRHRPHVVLLDVGLSLRDGLEAARQLLRLEPAPRVVLLSRDEQAFELRGLDDPAAAPATISRLLDRVNGDRPPVSEMVSPAPRPLERLAVRDADNECREVVAVRDIDYFRAQDDKTFARFRGREWAVSVPLAKLEAALPDVFFRSHRAYLVNLERIGRISPWFNGAHTLTLHDGADVPLSRGQAAAFRDKVSWL